MPALKIDFHPLAHREVLGAIRWYRKRSSAAAAEFVAELDRALAQIVAAPQRWAAYLHGTRVYRLHRFPYLVVYIWEQDTRFESSQWPTAVGDRATGEGEPSWRWPCRHRSARVC
jgi:plasmid stabilization system protein ParE